VDISIEQRVGVELVRIEGKLDFQASIEATEKLMAAPQSSPPRATMIIDASALSYVSSAGLRTLLTLAKSAQTSGRSLAVAAVQPSVQQVLDISGLTKANIFTLHPTVDAALQAAGAL